MDIKNILICGLGGLGTLCATKIQSGGLNLKVLVDEKRYEKYNNEITYFNGKPYKFDVITDKETDYKPDLIIIATKSNGLSEAIKSIKNFVHKDVIIISLLNGISSEEYIAKEYGFEKLLICFYIGHSCIRNGREITQDGIYKFQIGEMSENTNCNLQKTADFFEKSGINYEISQNIKAEYWKKFMINVGLNQISANYEMFLSEIKKHKEIISELKGLMLEVKDIAEKEGIKEAGQIYKEAEKFIFEEMKDAHTSMLQDIEAKRETEVDIFAGEAIKLGKKHGLKTPFNERIYKKIKAKEAQNKRINERI